MEDADVPQRLLSDANLELVSDFERQAYLMPKDRDYAHTQTIEESRVGGTYRETRNC
uniref:Uncharacterized protein n=3 Tax=Oryza sativa TaxID=4530 RepID=Q69IW1_ORYSJ|nr:hypothetical protein [Oryza sativa Japonica Group]BAD32090.1 hypothetical protein [Oryza sativa Japonica Group]BAI39782.1 hypothetical protein [Oryza sativa Indica Group]